MFILWKKHCYFFASYHSGLLNVVILTILLGLAIVLNFVHWSVLGNRLFKCIFGWWPTMTTIGSIEIPTREIRNYTICLLYIPLQLGVLLDFCCSDFLILALSLGLIADFFFCLPLRNIGCMFVELNSLIQCIWYLCSLPYWMTYLHCVPSQG